VELNACAALLANTINRTVQRMSQSMLAVSRVFAMLYSAATRGSQFSEQGNGLTISVREYSSTLSHQQITKCV